MRKNNKRILSKKKLIGALALAGVASAGVYSAANAYQGDYSKKGPNYSEERHAIMMTAFENNDYEAWKAEMEKNSRRGRVMDVINKDNFAKFAEAHRLGIAGDKEGADKIRAELGLRTSNGERGGHGYGKGEGKGNGEGRRNGEHRGENRGGHFEDKDGDGYCDHLNDK